MDLIIRPQYAMNRRSILGLSLKALGVGVAVAAVGVQIVQERVVEPALAFVTGMRIAVTTYPDGRIEIGTVDDNGEFEGRPVGEWVAEDGASILTMRVDEG